MGQTSHLPILNAKWVKDRQPCLSGTRWLNKRRSKGSKRIDLVMKALIKEKRYDWAEWLLYKELGWKGNILWAASIVREVLPVYENTYPGDLRPRRAIEAAEMYANEPSEENLRKLKEAKRGAGDAAWGAGKAEEEAAEMAELVAKTSMIAEMGAWAQWASAGNGTAYVLEYSGMPEEQIKATQKRWFEQGFEILMAMYKKPKKTRKANAKPKSKKRV